jgi:hypothetical protein
MNKLYYCFLLLLLALRCTPQAEELAPAGQALYFLPDTVQFDTVLAAKARAVETSYLYNPNPTAVAVNLRLQNPGPYNMLVLGQWTKQTAAPINLAGNDSLLLLIEIDTNYSPAQGITGANTFIEASYSSLNGSRQIDLPILGAFLQAQRPMANSGNYLILPCEAVFSRGSSYVFADTVIIDSACTLTVEAGTKLIFEPEAALFVLGTLLAEGTADAPIVFRGSRLEAAFATVPALWPGVVFGQFSSGNLLRHLQVLNAQTAIRFGTPDDNSAPDLKLEAVQLAYNEFGLVAFTSDISAENSLFHSSLFQNIVLLAGGNYGFNHCSIANFGSLYPRNGPAGYISNYYAVAENEQLQSPLNVALSNSAIWGNADEEWQVDLTEAEAAALSYKHSVIKSLALAPAALTNMLSPAPENDSLFVAPLQQDFRPGQLLINAGRSTLPADMLGNSRDSLPDVGALEFVPE